MSRLELKRSVQATTLKSVTHLPNFPQGIDEGWWNSARFLWRYGYSPITAKGMVSNLVKSFLRLYDPFFLHRPSHRNDSYSSNGSIGNRDSFTKSGYPWHSIEDLAKALNFTEMAAQDAESMFYNNGVSRLFVEEMIEAATRVNYGQVSSYKK